MSQYDMTMVYIPGEDNTVTNALSHVPDRAFPGKTTRPTMTPFDVLPRGINATLTITMDPTVLQSIQDGYQHDEFCKKLMTTAPPNLSITNSNGLWYIGDRLLIPCFGTIRENLFHLAHDTSGHFRADKSYATLRDAYYWPNMQRDLEKAYIPSCMDCLCNKSSTQKPIGPLHPLPIPDN